MIILLPLQQHRYDQKPIVQSVRRTLQFRFIVIIGIIVVGTVIAAKVYNGNETRFDCRGFLCCYCAHQSNNTAQTFIHRTRSYRAARAQYRNIVRVIILFRRQQKKPKKKKNRSRPSESV